MSKVMLNQIHLRTLLLALALGVSGCGAKEPAGGEKGPAAAANLSTSRNFTLNGISFELPWDVDNVAIIKAGQLNAEKKGFTFANDRYKVEVVEGRLKLNGVDDGPIGPGDRVKLTDKGVLTVNGAERKAAPMP
jgi:hypothetical protein